MVTFLIIVLIFVLSAFYAQYQQGKKLYDASKELINLNEKLIQDKKRLLMSNWKLLNALHKAKKEMEGITKIHNN
jgi:hypothetical protein